METSMTTRPASIEWVLLVTRLLVAFVTAMHGVQKLFGWFGGYGFDGTLQFFTQTIGLPYIFGVLIILAETVGMIALALGVFSRVFSGAVVAIMLGAIFSFHLPNGFYMNWGGKLAGEGYEYHLLMIGLTLPVLLLGGGTFSLDTKIFATSRRDMLVR
jgi:putative oxidoreductase